MRRKKTFQHGRLAPVLAAGFAGYLIGGWQSPALTGMNLNAAQAVALRFPQDWTDAAPAPALNAQPAEVNTSETDTPVNVQFALLNPEPMVAQPAAPAMQSPQQATVQMAALQEVKPAPASNVVAHPKASVGAVAAARSIKPSVQATHRSANRPGYLLDDAQIANIKQRLHLTPDQAAMWPAVEAALRNISYAKAQEARRRGNTGVTQTASIDPDSAEVQGLKSAAVPLIMSFNDEQKEEVRNLAHVMGLDQLASQF
jgi:hypothetical protein